MSHHLLSHALSSAAKCIERVALLSDSLLSFALTQRLLRLTHGLSRFPQLSILALLGLTELIHELL